MIAYTSRTGNVRYILSRLQVETVEIKPNLTLTEPFLLFTYTDGLGTVPPIAEQFMVDNATYCKGIIVSGNRNFGHAFFGRAGDILSNTYNIPLVRKLDLRGTAEDYAYIQSYYMAIMNLFKNTAQAIT